MEHIYRSWKRETIGIYEIAQLNQWVSLNEWPEIGPALQFLVYSSRRCWCFKYKWKTVLQCFSGRCVTPCRRLERVELCLFEPMHSSSLHWKCIILACSRPTVTIKCSQKPALTRFSPSWHLVLATTWYKGDFIFALASGYYRGTSGAWLNSREISQFLGVLLGSHLCRGAEENTKFLTALASR